jgi:signal peptidase II
LAFFILGIFLFFYVFNLKFKIFNLKSISNLKFQILNYSKLTLLGIILIISGGLSNIADRIMSGCVIDFIDLKFWPVFNLADIYITIGGIIILCVLFFKQR